MRASDKHGFGRTNVTVTAMGLGACPIGNYRVATSEQDAAEVVEASWQAGLRYFDTAPFYGHGLSEHRLGHALRWKDRAEYTISTKVGRMLRPARRASVDFGDYVDGLPFTVEYDYTYDGVMRSFEDSLQRLALESIDIALIHDCDVMTHGVDLQQEYFEQAMTGGYRALSQLRAEGLVGAIGLGVNETEVCLQALKRNDFDCFLLAGRYTLLDQSALDDFLPLCEEREVAIILGGGYNSGILATGAIAGARYDYAPASEPILERTRKIEAVCDRYRVPLRAAALQFVLAHPAIPTVVPGTKSVPNLHENVELLNLEIPSDLWVELKAAQLISPASPVPTVAGVAR